MKFRALILACALSPLLSVLPAETLSLDGAWGFALDPQRRGETSGWPVLPLGEPNNPWPDWDTVTVPHSWSGDARYEHTGAAWYVRSFEVPSNWTHSHLRLRFASVGDRCRIWLNGQLIASHDGVNLPFSVDITPHAHRSGPNTLVLEVDNSYSDTTLPGSRPGNAPKSQVYPWWNYGGILGAVTLESEPAHRIAALKTAYEFKADGSVTVTLRTKIENRGAAAPLTLLARITPPGAGGTPVEQTRPVQLEANRGGDCTITLTIPAAHVRRWNLDDPALYHTVLTLAAKEGPQHVLSRRLGLREIEVRGSQLLLNGEPVRLAGGNRSRGHAIWAGLEPPAVAEQDLTLLKDAHLEFARLQHYPIAESLLDWADEHGILIIAEAGNWQMAPSQLSSPAMQQLWRQQMQAMMENTWDRPSIIGWSVGNEYISWSPEGVAWTKEMTAWVRSLDASRPVTFSAVAREMRPFDGPKEEHSFHYVDFICLNYYGSANGMPGFDRVHQAWPGKPIMISEFGMRADQVKDESVRIEHFLGMLDEVRKRPFIAGLSYWCFNDYLSRYPGTTPGGYRAWGLVTGDRTPRELYHAMREALSPVTLTLETGATPDAPATLVITAQAEFPARHVRGHTLRLTPANGGPPEIVALPDLAPGEKWSRVIPPSGRNFRAEIIRPNGMLLVEFTP
jgi:beta-glucuronidase